MSEAVRKQIARSLRCARVKAGRLTIDVERELGLGRGWIDVLEEGDVAVPVDLLMTLLSHYGVAASKFFDGISASEKAGRDVFAEVSGNSITIHFRYASHDAKYQVANATVFEFESILSKFRELIARLPASGDEAAVKALKTNAIAETFLFATKTWAHVSPSDIWWFIVYRIFCDPFNHPADYARGDFGQSWKRSAGWALEEVVVRHYASYLTQKGVKLYIAPAGDKRSIAKSLTSLGRIDQPLSHALIRAGYFSPLWTMDCKSGPAEHPVNRGELGSPISSPVDRRSAKRKDIEDEGYFSHCFSYNANTAPSREPTVSGFKITTCGFANPEDEFSAAILDAWKRFRQKSNL